MISKNSLCMYLFSFPGTLLLFKGKEFLWVGVGGGQRLSPQANGTESFDLVTAWALTS